MKIFHQSQYFAFDWILSPLIESCTSASHRFSLWTLICSWVLSSHLVVLSTRMYCSSVRNSFLLAWLYPTVFVFVRLHFLEALKLPLSIIKIYLELGYLVDGRCSLVVHLNWGHFSNEEVCSPWSIPPVFVSYTFSSSLIASSSIFILCFDLDISVSSVVPFDEVYSSVKSTTPLYVSFTPPIFFSISSMVSC